MSKVTELKVPSTARSLGTFKVGVFNLFEDEERRAYETLRTQANDRSSGISIEHLQQFTRVTTDTQCDGDGQTTTRKEDLYVLVQYWEKQGMGLGKSADVGGEAPRDWHLERDARKE